MTRVLKKKKKKERLFSLTYSQYTVAAIIKANIDP